jgi:hypothetical protein
MTLFSLAHLTDIEQLDDGRVPFRPVRLHLGIQAFGVNAWTGRAAGDRVINEHDEADDGHEELYFVVSGRARFELGDETHDALAGTFVHVAPGLRRSATAEEDGTTVLAIGGVPGRAYEADDWELWEPLRPAYEAGRYDEVADRGRAVVEAHPGSPTLLYNLACAEALAGRKADAIEHLRRSIEGSERSRAFARGDSDFDALRGDPAFEALLEAPSSER